MADSALLECNLAASSHSGCAAPSHAGSWQLRCPGVESRVVSILAHTHYIHYSDYMTIYVTIVEMSYWTLSKV